MSDTIISLVSSLGVGGSTNHDQKGWAKTAPESAEKNDALKYQMSLDGSGIEPQASRLEKSRQHLEKPRESASAEDSSCSSGHKDEM